MALSAFHPTVAAWFRERLGEPTPAQAGAWPRVAAGEHVLVAAPTGSGKTLAAFLQALDGLLRAGDELPDETRVLYVSPLRALANDVRKNLLDPLAELRERDASLPEVRVLVRSGDTPASERQRMTRTPPHVLVTTPESLYILLTSESGRRMLSTVRTAIVDEVHAVLGSKRGAHLALSLERLEDLVGHPVQRVGLSATQKPLEDVARFLVGPERECSLVDEGHLRTLDLAVELPPGGLAPVLSHETWSEIHRRVAELVQAHRSTLVFVNTRKVCERTARELASLLGPENVTSHHSSLSKERRLEAEARLKGGELRALVATASLELGIDVGDVDLVVQIGATRSIATFLQRVGRAGHGVGRVPKGVLFPASHEELTEAAAQLLAVRRRILDVTPQPRAPLDVLAQQAVAACVSGPRAEDELFALARRAWPYRDLERERFDAVLALHAGERRSLLHRDPGSGTVRATRRARLVAVTSGGAIPDKADYRVVQEPEGVTVGSVDEDFAVESSGGDVFQLGNMSWRILRTAPGVMYVQDAQGAPPSLPFWFGEAPGRTAELTELMGEVRERGVDGAWLSDECGLDADVAACLAAWLRDARDSLGAMPTHERLVLERFPDESGGAQLVVHSLQGGRVNRAFGLALRKRFCRSFGFELQAAANEESVLISLGPMHSFALEEVPTYLTPESAPRVLEQALLAAPVFQTRWRWNVSIGLLAPRAPAGKRVPAPLQRMRADDLLASAFPDVVACGENLPPGDLEVPHGHPMVDQTLDDCMHEAMDVDGLVDLLARVREGSVEVVCVDTAAPSPLAEGALAIGPFGFLDDAGLEERRVQAVRERRRTDQDEDALAGVLDPAAVERVRAEAWPDPRDAEELHEALTWMGYARDAEAAPWRAWLAELAAAGRVERVGDRWYAAEASRDPLDALRGRLEVLAPFRSDDPLLVALEAEGVAQRVRLADDAEHPDGPPAWCHRRLAARVLRYQREDGRQRVRPVPTAAFRRFLASWHGLDPRRRFEGPAGVVAAVERLAGWEAPAPAWEKHLLPARVAGYRPEWLDQAGLAGQVAWGRLWGSSRAPVKSTPLSLFPRAESAAWEALAGAPAVEDLSWPARAVHEALAERGALFQTDLTSLPGLLPVDAERGLDELVAAGLVTSDSFAALRPHLRAPSKRRAPLFAIGRWSPFRSRSADESAALRPDAEAIARLLLRRYGVLFRAVLERERLPVRWRDLTRALRLMELRGDVHGGRFVDGYAGEQFADPAALPLLRAASREDAAPLAELPRVDPLALDDVLVPGAARLRA